MFLLPACQSPTSISEPKPLAYAEIGRGFLVVDYLKAAPEQKRHYLDELKENSDRYNGFSLVTIDRNGAGNYSLSSFSNRSNCLKRNQSDQRSYVITNSLRPDHPFYRGIVFKREFDTILAEFGLMNGPGNDPPGSALNIGAPAAVTGEKQAVKQSVKQETKQATKQATEQATEKATEQAIKREKQEGKQSEKQAKKQAAKQSDHQQASHADGNNAANLNNDQTNEQTNAQINDSLDNLRDCPSAPGSRASRSGHLNVDRVEDRKLAEDCEDCEDCRPIACAKKRAYPVGDCAKLCSRDCSLAAGFGAAIRRGGQRRSTNKSCNKTRLNETRVNDRADRSDKPIDFGEPAARQQLIRTLLAVMLSPRNYYEQEKNGDYFRSQTCLSNELSKRAIASLCISLPEHDYGSRCVIRTYQGIILGDFRFS